MMKLFKHIILLLILTIVADRIIGTVLEHLFYKQHHGDDYITIQVLDSTKADIIIVGSSRASHHYISDSIEEYTRLTTFNGGRDNMGIHYTKATIEEMLNRHQPKYIVFDIIPHNFINDNQNNQKYFEAQTSVMLPFANRHKTLYRAIGDINQQEVWKSKCIKTYAWNSLIGSILQNSFTNIGHAQFKGYEPLYGSIDASNYGQQVFAFTPISNGIDTNAFTQLKQCLQLCEDHHVKAILCFSPFYFRYHHEPEIIQQFNQMAHTYHTSILDYSSDPVFTQHADLFYDELHLNAKGAIIFSRKIAEHIASASE